MIDYGKVDGKENPADALTKGLDKEPLDKHTKVLGMVRVVGNGVATGGAARVRDFLRCFQHAKESQRKDLHGVATMKNAVNMQKINDLKEGLLHTF